MNIFGHKAPRDKKYSAGNQRIADEVWKEGLIFSGNEVSLTIIKRGDLELDSYVVGAAFKTKEKYHSKERFFCINLNVMYVFLCN